MTSPHVTSYARVLHLANIFFRQKLGAEENGLLRHAESWVQTIDAESHFSGAYRVVAYEAGECWCIG